MMTNEEIRIICEQYEIKNYTINTDGSIDVNGDVRLFKKKLTEIPLTFNKVSGKFDCSCNKLKSLKGCPREVGRFFRCHTNKLETLVGGPDKVKETYSCGNNPLTSLVGLARNIGGNFTCLDTGDALARFRFLFSRMDFPERKTFIRFMYLYDVWTPEFNEQDMLDLIEDIEDGLR